MVRVGILGEPGSLGLLRGEVAPLQLDWDGGVSGTRQSGQTYTTIMHISVLLLVHGGNMRATVSLDDDLLRTAEEYSGLTERAALIRAALKSLIAREAGRRLLALAGTAPNIEDVRRLRVDEQ